MNPCLLRYQGYACSNSCTSKFSLRCWLEPSSGRRMAPIDQVLLQVVEVVQMAQNHAGQQGYEQREVDDAGIQLISAPHSFRPFSGRAAKIPPDLG